MQMHGEAIACPLCGATETAPWGAENGWTAVKCRDCGLVYVNPRPFEQEISKANQLGEHRTEAGVLHVVYSRDERKLRHYREGAGSAVCRHARAEGAYSMARRRSRLWRSG